MLSNRSLLASTSTRSRTSRAQSMGFVMLIIATIGGPLATVSASPSIAQGTSMDVIRTADPFAAYVTEAGQRFRFPVTWIGAVMRAESAGDVRAVSSAGAMGLMQIMPQTWADQRVRHRLGSDPFDPRDNILAGTAYLREMYDRYGSPGFLAAYNAGPGRYEEHLTAGRALPAETRAYVAALVPLIENAQPDAGVVDVADANAWTRAPLFIARVEASSSADPPSTDLQPTRRPTRQTVADLSAITPLPDGLFVRRVASGAPR
jgi:soluble lytic murein transglycosylase-like protein